MPDATKAHRTCGLVLSLFPGAGLLDAGFTNAGYSVVRGPDTLLGQDIRTLTLGESLFDGIIAGPPCQDFSRARRRPPSGHGLAMLGELARLIMEALPQWFLVENVPGVPTLIFNGYTNQRFNLFASDFGLTHKRNRSFQFGSRTGDRLTIPRGRQSHHALRPTPLASTAGKRNFADHCELMGLPRRFTLPGLSRRAAFRAVGNGVPVPMACAVACAIRDRRVTANLRPCPCNCGRQLTGKQTSATVACRKRLQRERANVGPTARIFTGLVTVTNPRSHVHG
jgi:DNA (cytosine-5)-methyltransferase 1